jgi:Domain of unknown function (DUF4386)
MDNHRHATLQRTLAGASNRRTATPEMADDPVGSSPQVYARVAGVIWAIVAIMAPFAEFFVRQRLIVAGNVAATAENVVASQFLFRAGFASDLVVFVIEVALSAALYVLFRPVSRLLALIMSFARLAMVAILGLNLLNMYTALHLLTSSEYEVAFDRGQLQALAFVFLTAQSYGYALGMVFFGLHLGILGWLVYRSGFLPRMLGILMVVSALGYLANSFTGFLVPQYAATLAVLVVVTALIGELPLTLWLLIRGVDVEGWQRRALASTTRIVSSPVLGGATS